MLELNQPHNWVFTKGILKIEILGGIDLNHFDRLRCTLKWSQSDKKRGHLSYRQSIDLYHHESVEKMIRKLAEVLEESSQVLRKVMYELIDELEKYREENVTQAEDLILNPYELSKQEKQQVLEFLKGENLLERLAVLISSSGVVGERNNALLMYLIFTSRKMENPLHCISFGSSGQGKSHLQESISRLMPQEDVIEITSLSASSLYYFKDHELNHKLLLIEDLDGAQKALYPIRELQSKGMISKILIKRGVGSHKVLHQRVRAKVTIAGCTTKDALYEDNINRSFTLYLDESKEQDRAIMALQKKKIAGFWNVVEAKESSVLSQNIQRMLKQITVYNPYAELLELPSPVSKPRRAMLQYLHLINVITFLHQYQREEKVNKQTGEIYIEATLEDIKQAHGILKEILMVKSDVLSKATRVYQEQLQTYLEKEQKQVFSLEELRDKLKMSKTTSWRHHKKLMDYGYVRKIKQSYPPKYELIKDESKLVFRKTIEKTLKQNEKSVEQKLQSN